MVCALASVAMGQAINIDFGRDTPPPPTYAGVGLPGVWNSIEATHTSISNPEFVYNLVDIHGQPTGVTLHQFGGTELVEAEDPSVTGDHAELLNDCVVTYSQNLETCLFVDGLENGEYEVISYAWMPNHPEARARVRLDFNPTVVTVGGAWIGNHRLRTTYAIHTVQVTTGFMGLHSGNSPGGDLEVGAAYNGVQIRRLIHGVAGDFNDDGEVTLIDYDQFQVCVAGPGVSTRPPGCTVEAFNEGDLDNDNDVDMADFTEMQGLVD
jgi:hypothetical protein